MFGFLSGLISTSKSASRKSVIGFPVPSPPFSFFRCSVFESMFCTSLFVSVSVLYSAFRHKSVIPDFFFFFTNTLTFFIPSSLRNKCPVLLTHFLQFCDQHMSPLLSLFSCHFPSVSLTYHSLLTSVFCVICYFSSSLLDVHISASHVRLFLVPVPLNLL